MRNNSYADYFTCLFAGIYVAEAIAPRLVDETFFEKFLLTSVTMYGGALMGSYVYKLLSFDKEECRCGACCHDDESE